VPWSFGFFLHTAQLLDRRAFSLDWTGLHWIRKYQALYIFYTKHRRVVASTSASCTYPFSFFFLRHCDAQSVLFPVGDLIQQLTACVVGLEHLNNRCAFVASLGSGHSIAYHNIPHDSVDAYIVIQAKSLHYMSYLLSASPPSSLSSFPYQPDSNLPSCT
jgi:hypothetical protein